MISGLNLWNRSVNTNITTTSFKKRIWPFISTRHRKRLSTTAKCPKDICISHFEQSHINFIMQKQKSKRFPLTTKKISFNWSLKIISKNKKHFTRFAPLSIKKWNRGHGTTENSRNCIVTPICQSARLRLRQILVL